MTKYLIVLIFMAFINCKQKTDHANKYELSTPIFYTEDSIQESYKIIQDTFYAKNDIEALKIGSKLFILKTRLLKDVRSPLGISISDSKKEYINLEKLDDIEKKEIRDYLQPVIDSLGIK
ncbi:MAG: hypothetical protein J6O88_02930 [Chryseobacterium sp.]|uniref:hypothetical protein n=1 Tax=Chryseobacterium sp. TaxID=1871047 RepID=UPI001B145441|nr:hypothetical protein [Chryseobacterium sp.]MBO6183632.1 hypothetical protein [Chryseobacterium sp.]